MIEIINESKNQERLIKNSLVVMIQHMLKLKYQSSYPREGKKSWIITILKEQRQFISEFKAIGVGSLYNNFYLRKLNLGQIYEDAVRYASYETDLPVSSFPAECEWSKSQLADREFIRNFIEENYK